MRGMMLSEKANEPLLVFVREKVIHFQLQFHEKIDHYVPALTSRSAMRRAVHR